MRTQILNQLQRKQILGGEVYERKGRKEARRWVSPCVRHSRFDRCNSHGLRSIQELNTFSIYLPSRPTKNCNPYTQERMLATYKVATVAMPREFIV